MKVLQAPKHEYRVQSPAKQMIWLGMGPRLTTGWNSDLRVGVSKKVLQDLLQELLRMQKKGPDRPRTQPSRTQPSFDKKGKQQQQHQPLPHGPLGPGNDSHASVFVPSRCRMPSGPGVCWILTVIEEASAQLDR